VVISLITLFLHHYKTLKAVGKATEAIVDSPPPLNFLPFPKVKI
jgi:hypothetical protein